MNLNAKAICSVLWLGLTLTPASYADSMRCGTRLVQIDDLAIQVEDRCGKPISKEVIGYTLRGSYNYNYQTTRKREYKIEQWLYGPERGFYHELIFEAGRVKAINRISD